jgi:hypothetical protein
MVIKWYTSESGMSMVTNKHVPRWKILFSDLLFVPLNSTGLTPTTCFKCVGSGHVRAAAIGQVTRTLAPGADVVTCYCRQSSHDRARCLASNPLVTPGGSGPASAGGDRPSSRRWHVVAWRRRTWF